MQNERVCGGVLFSRRFFCSPAGSPGQTGICFCLYDLCFLFGSCFAEHSVPFVLTLAAVRAAGIPYKLFFSALKPVLWIILLSSFLHLWMNKGGDVVLSFSFITVYEEGIRQAGIIASRLSLLVAIASLLTFTTSPMDLTGRD